MKGLRKHFQTGSVVLTAIMTLLASSPHLDCLCPNGRIKPFCLVTFSNSFFSRNESCDLTGNQPEKDQHPAESCCCCSHHRAHAGEALPVPALPQIGTIPCQKVLAPIEAAASSAGSQSVSRGLPVGTLESAWLAFSPLPLALARSFRSLEQAGDLSPPGDLITRLQHLLI